MDKSSVTTRRFDGDGPNHNEPYRVWRKLAVAYCIVMQAKGMPEEALGPNLYCLLVEKCSKVFGFT